MNFRNFKTLRKSFKIVRNDPQTTPKASRTNPNPIFFLTQNREILIEILPQRFPGFKFSLRVASKNVNPDSKCEYPQHDLGILVEPKMLEKERFPACIWVGCRAKNPLNSWLERRCILPYYYYSSDLLKEIKESKVACGVLLTSRIANATAWRAFARCFNAKSLYSSE